MSKPLLDPLAGNPAADRAEALVPQANHRWQHHSVLVVDDEEGMRSFLTRMLASRCAMVETAASAEAAQLLFNRIHFDLIILDITLPGKSGVAWLAELREAGYQGEVILITAFADIDTAINALRAGASDFILKPFRVDQILNSMQRCFDRARLVRENFILRRTVEEMAGGSTASSATRRRWRNCARPSCGWRRCRARCCCRVNPVSARKWRHAHCIAAVRAPSVRSRRSIARRSAPS